MTTSINLAVNGRLVEARVEPRLHLADFLREHLRLSGTHLGCEHGVCGACTVLIDGALARSCLIMAVACDGLDVRTIEGFEGDDAMASLRGAFSRQHALQCGFCTPGMLITARDIVLRLPAADEARVRNELAGNLCRCTGYAGIVSAVRAVLEDRRATGQAGGVPKTSQAEAGAYPRATAAAAATGTSATSEPAAPMAVFSAAAEPATIKIEKVTAGEPGPGWTRFEESFLVSEPPASVWAVLADLPRVADCLPGAELIESDGRAVKGRLTVKLGPMTAAFVGSAIVERDDAALSGTISGAGTDAGSSSRTRGEVRYRLEPGDDGKATRVYVTADYRLQGTLAQFSRSGIAHELGRRIISEFAANLDRSLKGSANDRPTRLDAAALLWPAVWARIAAGLRKLRPGAR